MTERVEYRLVADRTDTGHRAVELDRSENLDFIRGCMADYDFNVYEAIHIEKRIVTESEWEPIK